MNQNHSTPDSTHIQQRWIIFTVILISLTELIDLTIVAVALPKMQGNLSASPTQITWTVTIYAIGAAILMPLTGMLSQRFGRKKLLMLSTLGFGISSALCGCSFTLWQIIFFRGLQGLFGALLPTLAQAALLDAFSDEKRNMAMALFGIGVVLGPAFGPVIGGFIVQHADWRWIFFINIPVCIVGIFLTLRFLPETQTRFIRIDWWGLTLLAVTVGCLQLFLDKGNQLGWLQSHLLQTTLAIIIISFIGFWYRSIQVDNPVIQPKLFADKNFVIACAIMLLYCLVIFGTFSWLPIWLELFMHYPSELTGELIIPNGLTCLVFMFLTPLLMRFFNPKWLVTVAALGCSYSVFLFTHFNLLQGTWPMITTMIFRGAATGLFFVPLTIIAYQTLSPKLLDAGSGVYNFFRSIGVSVGVALFSTLFSRYGQENWHQLVNHITPFNANVSTWLHAYGGNLHSKNTLAQLQALVDQQSHLLAYLSTNSNFLWATLLIVPLVWLVDTPKANLKQKKTTD